MKAISADSIRQPQALLGDCPYCGSEIDIFQFEIQQGEATCDKCGETFLIKEDED